jgi:hypothetical protein
MHRHAKTNHGCPPPNNRVQRAVRDKVHGRGRVNAPPIQIMCARVPSELRPVADAGRWAA